MSPTTKRPKALSAGVVIWLTPEERQRLREVLFEKGSVSLQSFFRQVALQEIREAAGQTPEAAHAAHA